MSDDERNPNNPNKKPRVGKGKSNGAYLSGKQHGVTNKFQAKWLQQAPPKGQPERKHWLSDGGESADGLYMVNCSLCSTSFQSRNQNVDGHEASSSHQKKGEAWMQKQKDRSGFQALLDKAAEYTAVQRAEQSADPGLHTLFASVFKHLTLGRPITDVCAEKSFLLFIKAPNVPKMHWSKNAG